MKVNIRNFPKNPDKERKVKIKIEYFDIWNLDRTISLILVPLLKKFKEKDMGAPFIRWSDVPESFKEKCIKEIESDPLYKDNPRVADEGWNCEEAWMWILDEMIFGFENTDDDFMDQCSSGNCDYEFVPVEGTELVQMVKGPNHTHVFDAVKYDSLVERAKNGRVLFAKYFTSLWI